MLNSKVSELAEKQRIYASIQKNLQQEVKDVKSELREEILSVQSFEKIQILVYKILNKFQNSIIKTVMGSLGAEDVWNLKKLQKWCAINHETDRAKKWTTIKTRYNMDEAFIDRVKYYAKDGILVVNEINKDELENALLGVTKYPMAVQQSVVNLLTVAIDFVNK